MFTEPADITIKISYNMKNSFPLEHRILLGLYAAVLLWSVINPKDLFTWFLEVVPALIGLAVVIATYNRFRLTTLVYSLLCVHSIILMIGGHYTYAEMPLFNWLRDTFGWSRNYYDRVGHFAQGFVPAIVVSEIVLRTTLLQRGKMFFFIIVSICLAISAMYEFFEWWVALAIGENADAFLATQGDVWDTQWDMFLALCGAVAALMLLQKVHEAQLKKLMPNGN
jgi:putative membrane protein